MKRPVRRLPLLKATEGLPSEAAKASSANAPLFTHPNPRGITVGGTDLETHLKHCGVRDVFIIDQLLKEQDWSGFETAYSRNGRPAYSPRAMMGLIMYGILQGQSSLRELEQFARVNLSCWWLTGSIMPDHSVIGRFIELHRERLTDDFFVALTEAVLKATKSGVSRSAGDGTVIEAAASRYRLLKRESLAKAVSKQRERVAETGPAHPAADKLEQLEQAEALLATRAAKREAKGKDPETTRINPLEPEAVVQPLKRQGYGASYKPSVIANEQRVIVAQAVHPSSETEVVPALLDQAARHGTLEETYWDAGYHCESVLEAAAQRDICLLTPEGRSSGDDWNKQSCKQYPKSRFTYDSEQDSYQCPAGHRLTKISRYAGNPEKQHKPYILYGTPACATCPLTSQCTRSKKGRHIKRYPGDVHKDTQRQQLQDETVRQRYRQRAAWVEPVFSVLKGKQRLTRFRRRGLAAVRLEFALHAIAYNLGRVVALFGLLIGLISHVSVRFYRFIGHPHAKNGIMPCTVVSTDA